MTSFNRHRWLARFEKSIVWQYSFPVTHLDSFLGSRILKLPGMLTSTNDFIDEAVGYKFRQSSISFRCELVNKVILVLSTCTTDQINLQNDVSPSNGYPKV